MLEDQDSNGFERVDRCSKLTAKKGQTGIRDLPDMNHTTKTQYQKFETNIPGKELRGFSPNSYIHVFVSHLHIPLIGLPILLQENR